LTRIAVTRSLAALLLPLCPAIAVAESPSFVNEVVPLLTRHGCNQGACHGKGSGQNGFRLSLRGYAPEWDHDWITREFGGRRVNTAVPEASLLLLKPSGKAAHHGGKLFDEGSRPYKLLLDWIRAGAFGPQKGDAEASKLRVTTNLQTLKTGEEVQLQVKAEFAPGVERDVTWLCRFASNDPGMAEVDAGGRVRVKRHGETTVRVSFQTQVAVVIITVPFEQSVKAEAFARKNNFIDDHVFAKLAALHLEPSGLCGDAEFLRRACLDTLGMMPTPDEVRAFLADKRPDKRARVIEELLKRPEFVDHWALFLGDLLQNRKERDHDVRGTKGVRAFHAWLRRQIEENRRWDTIATSILTTKGSTDENPAVGYFVVTVGEHGEAHRSEVGPSVAQAFLGTRIGCAQCHNHPLERYTQDDYYHFAAFFSRLKLQRKDPKDGPTSLLVAGYDSKPSKAPVGVVQPRTGRFLAPQPLDRSAMSIPPEGDPREHLARWMTDPKNEYFAGAMVNRLWRHFLGVGLVEPVDDLRGSNPPTNPELWKALIQEFVAKQYDLRHLMRVILNSRTYQLSSSTTVGNSRDKRFHSHYYARRLPAEVLLDAITQATEVPDRFPGYPEGTRAGQLPDPTLKSYFLTVFGRSERVTACACERSGEVTLPQVLHLQNGETIVQKIASGQGRLARLLKEKKTDKEMCDELFLATAGRIPTQTEKAVVGKMLADGERVEVLRDLFWALLNSKEFSFNR
jgi:hypothetical protein